jgi:hypothetical protein
MDTIRFTGRIIPKVVELDVSFPEFQWNEPELGISTAWRLSIFNSRVEAQCDSEKFLPDKFSFYFIRASDFLEALINIMAFNYGISVHCSLEKVIYPNGIISSLLARTDFDATKLCTAYRVDGSGNYSLSHAAVSVFTDPSLFLYLSDLIGTLRTPQVSVVNCGRVIDSIRRMIAPNVGPAAGWKEMHEMLNVSQGYQEYISKIASNPRHGDRSYIPGNITGDVLRRTWIIFDRYLHYKLGARKKLNLNTFPILT